MSPVFYLIAAITVAGALAAVLLKPLVHAALAWAVLLSAPTMPGASPAPVVTVHDIGVALVGRYVLPLEIVALLLTAATIGAVIVAMHEKEGAR